MSDDPKLLTREELAAIAADYSAEPVPPCRICGSPLMIGAEGGGFTHWHCWNWEESHPKLADLRRWPWQTDADVHWEASYFVQRRTGDSRVLALLRHVEALEERLRFYAETTYADFDGATGEITMGEADIDRGRRAKEVLK